MKREQAVELSRAITQAIEIGDDTSIDHFTGLLLPYIHESRVRAGLVDVSRSEPTAYELRLLGIGTLTG